MCYAPRKSSVNIQAIKTHVNEMMCATQSLSPQVIIIQIQTVLYSWQNNGELVTRHCKQSNKVNLWRDRVERENPNNGKHC